MNIQRFLFSVVVMFFSSSDLLYAQSYDDMNVFLNREIAKAIKTQLFNDTLHQNKCGFALPHKSSDGVAMALRMHLEKERKNLEKYCKKGCEISIDYEVKSYVNSIFISAAINEYYQCPTMPSNSFSTTCQNYIVFNGSIFEIKLNIDDSFMKEVNLLVQRSYDKDCMENGTLSKKLNFFVEDGKFFLNDPLHSKVCIDPVEMPEIRDHLVFIKISK